MPSRSLIFYASFTGNTAKVAERFQSVFIRNGWHCDSFRIRKTADDILRPAFDPQDYDFVCVGSGIRSHLPYNEVLNVLRRFRLGDDPRHALRWRDETIPYIDEPLPETPPPWRDPGLIARHRKIVLGPASPPAVVFVTYSGYEFGPREAEPALSLLQLEIEHLGFRCLGRFSCPGRFLDDPTPLAYHGDIRDRPNEADLTRAEYFLEDCLQRSGAGKD